MSTIHRVEGYLTPCHMYVSRRTRCRLEKVDTYILDKHEHHVCIIKFRDKISYCTQFILQFERNKQFNIDDMENLHI